MCDPATQQVQILDPAIAVDGGPHQTAMNVTGVSFIAAPSDHALTAAINACRLDRTTLGGCISFALEYIFDRDAYNVVLLYNVSPETTGYQPSLSGTPVVYTIAPCLQDEV